MDQLVWQEAFRILTTNMPKFIYPAWFAYLAEHIPVESSRARRDVPRLISFLKVIARCRSFSDGTDGAKEIEISFSDYCVAYAILNDAFASTYTGAHPRVLEFAQGVRDLHEETKRSVLTKDVQKHLNWEKEALAHKWRAAAVKQKLVRYEEGTHQNNKKPLLPDKARKATAFLPDPQLIFKERLDLGEEVTFVDPISGEERILRRSSAKSQNKS
jgi:hypothetical protein